MAQMRADRPVSGRMPLVAPSAVPDHGSIGEQEEVVSVVESSQPVPGAIAVTGRTTAVEIGDRVEVQWRLTAAPGLEWTEVFQFTEVGMREGAVDWRDGGGPDVVRDTVRWFVPSSELDEAEAEVAHRLAVANERCGT
jgi:hypothetical protein